MGRTLAVVLAGGLIAAAEPALAWSAAQERNSWYVRDGDIWIPMPNEKVAERTAERLDRAEDRAEKRAERAEKKVERAENRGVVATAGTPCADPNAGVRC